MKDRGSDPSAHALQKEIGKILSAAAAESREAELVEDPAAILPARPYVLWRGAGLVLGIASGWPAELSQPLQPLIFIAACTCLLVALIQYLRLPDQAKRFTKKSAKLHRIR